MTTKGRCLCRAATWVSVVEPNRLRFTGAQPSWFASSPGVRRGFCGRCGSPLTYEHEKLPGEVHLLGGALEDPGSLKPQAHIFTIDQLAWFDSHDDLPRYLHYPPRRAADAHRAPEKGVGFARSMSKGGHMKALYLIVAAAVALAGCSSTTESMGRKKCDDDRFAVVSVEDDKFITVSPEPIVVCKQNAKITWSFAADVPRDYKFVDRASNGKKSIEFKDPSQFENCRAEANGARYSCSDKKTVNGAYKYIIILEKPGGGSLESIDPHVVND